MSALFYLILQASIRLAYVVSESYKRGLLTNSPREDYFFFLRFSISPIAVNIKILPGTI